MKSGKNNWTSRAEPGGPRLRNTCSTLCSPDMRLAPNSSRPEARFVTRSVRPRWRSTPVPVRSHLGSTTGVLLWDSATAHWNFCTALNWMEMSCSDSSLYQLQSELETSCSGRSEQDWFVSGQGYRVYPAIERFRVVRELNSKSSFCRLVRYSSSKTCDCLIVRGVVAPFQSSSISSHYIVSKH